ncbi:uncharacterized protein LOC128342621 isoform X2 [Hemicordylus capensis]|uniref:uncharacterized protein LOC128342621 isoform X2 n=1 Tax=Hemicordylus capensis TaxID=884348 RepID=UPI002304BBB6|nr:uncharacterized protein LOC128342621 isoform X2 [Hemicordylus capensis]
MTHNPFTVRLNMLVPLIASLSVVSCAPSELPRAEGNHQNGCPLFPMEIQKCGTKSLILPFISPKSKSSVVKCSSHNKCNEEVVWAENSNSEKGITLVGQNFTVRNASRASEGHYKIIQSLDDSCLAEVNVTLVPISSAKMPSSTATSSAAMTVSHLKRGWLVGYAAAITAFLDFFFKLYIQLTSAAV